MKKIITIKENANIVTNEHAYEILNFTPQLYLREHGKTDGNKIEPCASGILFTHNDQYFLITAGHVVVDNDPTDLGLLENNIFHLLTGKLDYVNPYKDEISNKIDLAIFRLENKLVNKLQRNYKFLNSNNIVLNFELKENEPRYLVVGYPWRKSKLNPQTKTIKPKPFSFLTTLANDQCYEQMNLEKHTNILLSYYQRKIIDSTTGYKTKGVNPEGISGCGLWLIDKFLYDPLKVPPLKLLGIVTEQDKNKKFLQATRSDFINEILIRDFGLALKHSDTVRLRHKS